MPWGALAAGIAATASQVSSLYNRWRDKRDQQDMMNYQNILNRQNFEMQNFYNSPNEQMKRLKAAGLNPNLVYQNGGASLGAGEIAAPSSTSFTSSALPTNQFGNYMDFANYLLRGQEVQNQTDTLEMQKSLNKAYENLAESQKQMLDKEIGWKDRMLYQDFVAKQMGNLVSLETANNLRAKTGLTRQEADSYYVRLQSQLNNDKVQRNLGRANIREINKRIDQINELIGKTRDERRLLQLEYARGEIAKRIEEMTENWNKEIDWSNPDDSSWGRSNFNRMLDKELELIEKQVLGNSISNISNPIRDIVLPVGITLLGAGKLGLFKKAAKIGF